MRSFIYLRVSTTPGKDLAFELVRKCIPTLVVLWGGQHIYTSHKRKLMEATVEKQREPLDTQTREQQKKWDKVAEVEREKHRVYAEHARKKGEGKRVANGMDRDSILASYENEERRLEAEIDLTRVDLEELQVKREAEKADELLRIQKDLFFSAKDMKLAATEGIKEYFKEHLK